jgi:hypothetical protein
MKKTLIIGLAVVATALPCFADTTTFAETTTVADATTVITEAAEIGALFTAQGLLLLVFRIGTRLLERDVK